MTKDDLFEYLNSDANEYGLDAVAAHGFLTASVVGKPLPNWISLFFEGNDSQVSGDVKHALQAWQDELRDTLKNEAPIELPFVADDNAVDFGEESDVVAWSIGFVDAMYADESVDWFDDVDTEEDVANLTLPMIILSGIDEEDEELVAMRANEDMMAQLVNSLEDNITELFLLFHTQE